MSSHPSEDVLRRIPLLRRLSPSDRTRIGECARVRSFGRGEEVFREGDPGDAFLLIIDGRVKVFKSTSSGKQIILEIFGAGNPLGAVAVYEGAPFPASAVALEDTTLLRVEARDFFRLLEQHPALVRGLLSGLTIRIAELTRRLTELTGGRVETRFARLFLKLADQMGRAERGGVFIPLPLARQELADLTGTTIETCIRIMSRWEKENVLHTDKDGFVVLDREELEAVAS
ncbi:MAG: Crp/Fnr family transcriptional regulator [Acidobacteria bacterium]|nr:Crp/Fnr family transcriptional regulator [Acidobacteriota bacterium]HQZ37845.1 Crp/Fnr family transcriptional regulator [Vicinamibacterales bacterium]